MDTDSADMDTDSAYCSSVISETRYKIREKRSSTNFVKAKMYVK